jgi:hypothetical protein
MFMSVTSLKPVVISKFLSNQLLSKFDPQSQSYRILKYLSSKKKVPTGELAANTSCGNISQIVRTVCNIKLMPEGFQVRCEKPLAPIKNRFDQDTNQYVWSLCRVVEERISA